MTPTTANATKPVSASAVLRQMAEPEFVASLSEERATQLRRSVARLAAWAPWIREPLAPLLTVVGGTILATKFLGPLPSALVGGAVVCLVLLSLLAALALWVHASAELHDLLTPFSSDTTQCREALALIQASPLCHHYQAQVLAHPRAFMRADLLALETLVERARKAEASRERQAACAALHQLDLAKK